MRIHQNQSLFVQNRYNHTNTELNKTLNKLSSGYRINKAADDAAGLAISEKMRAQIRGLDQASRNIQDGISVINVMDGALGTMQSPMLNRLRELIIQGATDTNTANDRAAIKKEIDEIIEGIDDIVHNTEFNTIKTFVPPSNITGTPTASGKADIVFIIDNTGSMGTQIQNVRDNIGNFVSSLKANNIDVNLGLVTYGDQSKLAPQSNSSGDNVPTQLVGFPLDLDSFKNEVDNIQLTSGYDWEESGLEGIMKAHSIADFRPGATKNYVLITDAPVHECQPAVDRNNNNVIDPDEYEESIKYSSHSIQSVIDSLAGTAKISVITDEFANTNQLSPLHTETGGLFLNINGAFGEQLLTLAKKITDESGGTSTEESIKPLIIQSGANEGQQINIPLYDHRDFRLFLKDIALSPYSSAMEALSRVDTVIAKISNRRAEYGAISNRLEHAYTNVVNTGENLTQAESQLRDADLAKATIQLQKDQVLLQTSQTMMAQINQMSQGILQLLR